ncbi:MAG: hypothetical protein ACOZIN_19010 [Myxococcota bacterium]
MPLALLLAAHLAAGPTEHSRVSETRKSTSFLIAGGELGLGLAGGYIGLLAGIALNLPRGGVSLPPDTNDVLLIGLLPALAAAGPAWAFGLFDLSQRGFVTSLLLSAAGAAVGELAGLGVGLLLGRSLTPDDEAAAVLLAMFAAPAFAALGAMLSMELFKGGETVATPTVALVRTSGGSWVLQPSLRVAF